LRIDCGYLDFHVHVGEPIGGYRLRDGFADLARLTEREDDPANPPLAGIGVFVTQQAGKPLAQHFDEMREAAAKSFPHPICWHLSPTTDSVEDVIPLLEKGVDLKFYTTYREAGLYSSYEVIERWMDDLSSHKTRILVHCEDDACIQEHSAKHPFRQPLDHARRRPELAEIIAVTKVLDLAVKHRYPVHIVHVSSPKSALLIQQARAHYSGISCETAPHYLLHNESDLLAPQAHRLLCTPPFRSEQSRGMMVELLQDGVFDILASDHCAFTLADKDRYQDDLSKVPNGIPGVQTLFTSVYEAFVKTGKIKYEQLEYMTRTRVLELMNL
jgi:dihydropyrimidinase